MSSISKSTNIYLLAMAAAYLALMAVKTLQPAIFPPAGLLMWIQEITLNLTALLFLFSAHEEKTLDQTSLSYLKVSLLATITASTVFQILSRGFSMTLAQTMGTPFELLINIPYMTCFAMALAALVRGHVRGRGRVSAVLCAAAAFVILMGTFLFVGTPLEATGFPLQNRIIHWMCFTLEAGLMAFGVLNLAIDSRRLRFLSLGYASIAFSGYLFQLTEIFKGTSFLDIPLDVTWTVGQFLIVAGLGVSLSGIPVRRLAPA